MCFFLLINIGWWPEKIFRAPHVFPFPGGGRILPRNSTDRVKRAWLCRTVLSLLVAFWLSHIYRVDLLCQVLCRGRQRSPLPIPRSARSLSSIYASYKFSLSKVKLKSFLWTKPKGFICSGGIAPRLFTTELERSERSFSYFSRFTLTERALGTCSHVIGWATIWTWWRRENSLHLLGIEQWSPYSKPYTLTL